MYLARTILKALVYILPALMALLLLQTIMRRKNRIIIKEGLSNFLRMLPLLLLTGALYFGICLGCHQIDKRLTAAVKLRYDYMYASEGLNPNRTKLDVTEILDHEVMEKVIDELELDGITPDELRTTLSVVNVHADDSVSSGNYYLSTEYMINYRASQKSAAYVSSDIVAAAANAYRTLFIDKYGRKFNVITEDYGEADMMDYLDVYTYLDSRLKRICDYMEMCEGENVVFVSERTGESFRSLKEKAQNYKSIALERYKAYILKNSLSKNSRQYIDRLNYINRVINLGYMKDLAAYGVRLAAIDKYERDMVTSILVPSRDSKGEYYQSRTKNGIDYFAGDAAEFLQNAAEKQLKIEENNYLIAQLSQPGILEEKIQKADVMISELKGQIEELSKSAVKTVEDYDRKICGNYITLSFPEESAMANLELNRSAVYAGVFFFLMMITTILHERKEQRK